MIIKLKCCKFRVRPEANRLWVLREQKVLPGVRNRPLLLREFLSFSIFNKCYESNTGSFRLTHSISDIPMTPSCSLRSLELEVGVMRVACQYRLCNLRFKHKGYVIGFVTVVRVLQVGIFAVVYEHKGFVNWISNASSRNALCLMKDSVVACLSNWNSAKSCMARGKWGAAEGHEWIPCRCPPCNTP